MKLKDEKKIFKHIYQHIKLINENQKDIFDCVEKITKEIKKTLKNKKTIFCRKWRKCR